MEMAHLVGKWMVRLTFVVLGGTVAAAGAQGNVSSQLSGKGFVPDAKDPYAKVFRTPQDSKDRQDLKSATPSTSPPENTRVVCGMVVVPVTPSADPKMLVQPKKDAQPAYSMRKISPQMCNE